MTTTATKTLTLAEILNEADPNDLADCFRKMKMGRMLDPVKITLAAISAVAGVNLTSQKKGDSTLTINSGLADLATGEALPAAQIIKTVRVTASGTAASVGTYICSDAGGTPTLPTGGASAGVGICTLSDDGKTLTFPNTVTGVVVEYIPRSAADMTAVFAPST